MKALKRHRQTNIPYAESDTWRTLFVRKKDLRPGDFFLTSYPAPTSAAAKAASADGPYSHMVLVLNNSFVLESAPDGVFFSSLWPFRFERDHREPFLWNCLVQLEQPPSRLGHFRHRAIYRLEPAALERTLDALAAQQIANLYPAPAVALHSGSESLSKLVRVPEGGTRKPEIADAGAFCAELAAKFLAELRLPLLGDDDGAGPITPNTLARSPHIKFIEDSLCEPDEHAEVNETLLEELLPIVRLAPRRALLVSSAPALAPRRGRGGGDDDDDPSEPPALPRRRPRSSAS
ncbi:MAG: hypothetical protein WCP29_02845 [Acidobacteriota bacterium]